MRGCDSTSGHSPRFRALFRMADSGELAHLRRAAAEAAASHHAEVTEAEVVLHRIQRIELPQRRRDVGRHLPAGALVARELQAPADADDMRVERNHELRWRHGRPPAWVDAVLP